MNFKLLALDIDGTLVPEHSKAPSQKIITAVQEAKKKIQISLVSARAWKEQQTILNLLDLNNYYHVVENGTKVVNPKGEIEYHKYIPASEVQKIIDVTTHLFNEIGFCINSRWFDKYQNPERDIVSTLSLISYSRKKAESIPKIMKKLPKKYSVSVGAHWNNPLWAVTLISHKDVSKGLGLKYIQQKLNISANETIAIGDGASDVSTMRFAKVKVAMGNAEPELKSVANYIAPTVYEDGVADVISKFIILK